jgi:hypothetical protein
VNRTQRPAYREGVTPKKASHSREWKLLVVACTLSGLIVWLGDEPLAWVFAIGLLTGAAVAVARADLLHPYTWYAPVFLLYSTFFPIQVWSEKRMGLGFLHEVCLLEWVALATFIVVVGPSRRQAVPPLKLLTRLGEASLPVFWISAGVAAIVFWYLRTLGFISKHEIALSSSPIVSLGGPAFSVLTLAFAAVLASKLASRRIPYILIATTVALSLGGLLIAGERDMVIRVIVVVVFLLHALYRRIKAGELAALFFLGLLILTVSAQFRNLMLETNPMPYSFQDPTQEIIGGEFAAAGMNLEGVIEEMQHEDFFWGETLWWDVKRVFIPGFMEYPTTTPGRWYNQRRFPVLLAHGGGRGFTVVGEGYMNFGPVGVIIWFIMLGLMVKKLYFRAGRSGFWFVTYIVSTTLFLYVIREDFANLFSQMLKHIVFPLVVIYAVAHVIEKLGLQQAVVPSSAKARSG